MGKVFLVFIYMIATTLGMLGIKIGGDSILLSFQNGLTFKIGFITLLGFVFYLLSFVLWQKLLITFDLSYIVPITTGLMQIIVFIFGILLFKEEVGLFNIFGILFIIIGIVFLSLKITK